MCLATGMRSDLSGFDGSSNAVTQSTDMTKSTTGVYSVTLDEGTDKGNLFISFFMKTNWFCFRRECTFFTKLWIIEKEIIKYELTLHIVH